ncbi:YicC/YloC family endoribonuclease [Anaerobranca gottschalkii]|uniref:TIGR00255 family protein n=1 Tax=Anaerobranca gottschalkii DSM 13577 TaxID=1120990 RepID=A0A1H9YX16_9FIRM|nr:YicC/YloC family endoribonuclease [Anaerobranca gottschalkii]SES73700.1 TIGR00255 family protein [Anaerobranca gottschalkii DSM 13577]
MIKSMTGFSRQLVELGTDVFSLEIKGVNNRYLDIVVKIPDDFSFVEEEMKLLIKSYIKRGRVEVRLKGKNNLQPTGQEINKEFLLSLVEQVRNISEELNLDAPVNIQSLLLVDGVIMDRRGIIEESLVKEQILFALRNALDEFDTMRFSEGQRLKVDIEERIGYINNLIQNIKEYSLLVVEEYREKLYQRVNKLKIEGLEFDENRLLAEIALFAERCNITEEIIRLESHMVEFNESLYKKESVGRKLDFLLQEINREINTIGSKANNYQIAKLVVELKGEVEKIREQIQNIE